GEMVAGRGWGGWVAPDIFRRIVSTTPDAVIRRVLWLTKSATYMYFCPEVGSKPTATALGELKLAPGPVPSVLPGNPLPARVVTTPAGLTTRILWLPKSATKTLSSASAATPFGNLNFAAAPAPSAKPIWLPARVVTTPSAVILRMVWFPVSAT